MNAPKLVPNYTVDDYQNWQGDWELWDGIPVSMSPSPFGPHSAAVVKVITELVSQLRGCDAQVLTELDWIVDKSNVVRPDVVVVCGDIPSKHIESPPALIVEVISEESRQRDTVYKPELCKRHGVAYALVDPMARTVQGGNFRVCENCVVHLSNALFD